MAARGRYRAWIPSAVLAAGACGALSPDPEAIAAGVPPARELAGSEARRLDDILAEVRRGLAAGDVAAAESAARRALAIQPRSAPARAGLGTALMRRAQAVDPPDLRLWREAEGQLLAATRIAPADPDAAVSYGRFLVADGHLTAAAEAAERILEQAPAEVRALRLAADCRYELGEERLALPHLRQLRELDPDPQVEYRLGWCLLRIAEGEREAAGAAWLEAADHFAAFRRAEPGDPDGYLAEGRAVVRAAEGATDPADRQARAERALGVYRQAAERFPGAVEPVFGAAVCLELLGRAAEAGATYERALERDPRHVGSLLNLAALSAADRRDYAVDLYRRALEEDLTSEERRRVSAFLEGR